MNKMTPHHRQRKDRLFCNNGFTLMELLFVIAIIGILASVVVLSVLQGREAAYLSKAKQELANINVALQLYSSDNNGNYPPDVFRDIPPGLEEYLAPEAWPNAAWPGSVFDWENWDDPDTGEKIYQISIRFCEIGDSSNCRFPNRDWADDFDHESAVFYCVSGACRSYIHQPPDHPGYCTNCTEHQYPYGIY
ncbi:MAG: type II secretion system protein [Candidatus Paceibacterota bacterium]